MTSTAGRPIDPPEPRSATRRGLPDPPNAVAPLPCPTGKGPPSADEGRDIRRHRRGRKDERVHAVEYAAMARDQAAGVFGSRSPFEHRFSEVTRLRGNADQWPCLLYTSPSPRD